MRFRLKNLLIVSALAAGACASDEPTATTDAQAHEMYLGLTTPSDGFQVRSVGADIMSGEDVEYCEVGRLPGEPSQVYYAKSFEFGNGTHSHHLIVSAAEPGGAAEAKLQALGEHNRVPCLSAETAFGQGFTGMGGSQTPYRELSMPEGVGQEYHGGQWIVFDYHYLNSSDETVQARSAINVHLTDRKAIQHVARGFNFNNVTIATAPASQASFTGECHFTQDVMLGQVTRHTHRWGKDFTVWYAGGERDGEEIWRSDDWEHDTDHTLDAPVLMHAGDGLRFRCSYQNDTQRMLRYGTSATDEMCILFGTLWEADSSEQLTSQSCRISWNDADGVGHSVNEAGGVPAPSEAEAKLCLANSDDNACARCTCEKCATSAIRCSTDAECKAILDCYSACTEEDRSACNPKCEETIDAHSSGLGLLNQFSDCRNSQCGSACNP